MRDITCINKAQNSNGLNLHCLRKEMATWLEVNLNLSIFSVNITLRGAMSSLAIYISTNTKKCARLHSQTTSLFQKNSCLNKDLGSRSDTVIKLTGQEFPR